MNIEQRLVVVECSVVVEIVSVYGTLKLEIWPLCFCTVSDDRII